MKLTKHFEMLYRKEMIRKGKLVRALCANYVGYKLDHERNVVTIELKASDGDYTLERLPFPMSYYEECRKDHMEYHIKHPSTQKEVRRKVYITSVHNGVEELIVVSPDPASYEVLDSQYKATQHSPDGKITYEDCSIFLDNGFSGILRSEKMLTFENIVEYERAKDVVTCGAKSW